MSTDDTTDCHDVSLAEKKARGPINFVRQPRRPAPAPEPAFAVPVSPAKRSVQYLQAAPRSVSCTNDPASLPDGLLHDAFDNIRDLAEQGNAAANTGGVGVVTLAAFSSILGSVTSRVVSVTSA